MIDPANVDRIHQANLATRQEFVLFAALVAGKRADVQARKLDALLEPRHSLGLLPFGYINWLGYALLPQLLEHGTGQYGRLSVALAGLARLDVDNLTLEALEAIPGIGPKTARFILLVLQPEAKVAALDTHILRFLREEHGVQAPEATPQSRSLYRALEAKFVEIAAALGLTPAQLDIEVWRRYSGAA